MLDDFLIGALHGLRQRRASRDFAHHRIARNGAGYLAMFMAAHTIGDQPKAEFGVSIVSVLVMLATQADMGAVAELDHAGDVIPMRGPHTRGRLRDTHSMPRTWLRAQVGPWRKTDAACAQNSMRMPSESWSEWAPEYPAMCW